MSLSPDCHPAEHCPGPDHDPFECSTEVHPGFEHGMHRTRQAIAHLLPQDPRALETPVDRHAD